MTIQCTRPGRETVFRARLFVAHYLPTGEAALAAKAVLPEATDFARAGCDLLESPEVQTELRYWLGKISVEKGLSPAAVLLLVRARGMARRVMKKFGLPVADFKINTPNIRIIPVKPMRGRE